MIDRIQIENFRCIAHADVAIETPVTLICGLNGAGKTSVLDAVRFAIQGEPGRVQRKKDYRQLLAPQAKRGSVSVLCGEHVWQLAVESGKSEAGAPDTPAHIDLVLSPGRFAALSVSERRQRLFSLCNVSMNRDTVAGMLRERVPKAQMEIEKTLPLLRGGFAPAHKFASDAATEAKGAWRALTHETYGANKADNWAPDKPNPPDEAAITQAQQRLDGAYQAQAKASEARAGAEKRQQLRQQAERLSSLEQNIQAVDDDLARLAAEIDALSQAAPLQGGALYDYTCAECGSTHKIIVHQGRAAPAPKDAADPVVGKKLSERKREYGEFEAKRRQLDKQANEAKAARQALEALPEQAAGFDDTDWASERNEAQLQLDALKQQRSRFNAAVASQEQADQHHREVQTWSALADALAPNGIPAELLATAMDPFNQALARQSEAAGWRGVSINAEMSLQYGGRDYALLSESERWRVDASVAVALAHLSGWPMVLLDRLDVLDPASRGQALRWLSECGCTALVAATLKARPSLPASVGCHWIEHGRVTTHAGKAA